MILELYIPLIALSVILILIGIIWASHTEFAIVGFVFLIYLSTTMMGGAIEYRTGSNLSADVFYTGASITEVNQTASYQYIPWDDTDSHQFGKYLLFGSMLGCAVMFFLIGRTFF
jgi:hypothetical protein